MSADNVITILSTPGQAGNRVYRVAEHADSGSPISHYCEEEDGPLKARVIDPDYLVRIFTDAPVFDDGGAAYSEAARLEDEYGFVEYGISRADVEESWEQLIERAEALREKRKQCAVHNPTQDADGWVIRNEDSIDWWSPNYVVSQLLKLGWHQAEAEAARDHLQGTYETGDDGKYQYADRLRFARLSNPQETTAFRATESAGCCGSYGEEVVVLLPDGSQSRILVGFNYGH